MKGGCVYIMSNRSNSVLYIGVTSDLITRVDQHKTKYFPQSFSSRYKCFKLVYFESYHHIEEALAREKELKGFTRRKKEVIIDTKNPHRIDLYDEVLKW